MVDLLHPVALGDLLAPVKARVEELRDRLLALGYAEDAARETDELLLVLRQFHCLIEVRVTRLGPVWTALDRWISGDLGEDDVREALARYR